MKKLPPASCNANFTVKARRSPVLTCRAGSVREGETKVGSEPGTFTSAATLDTTGAPPGPVNVTMNVTDIHGFSGSRSTTVNGQAPPPQVASETPLSEREFETRRARVDNQCKAQLDAVALRLLQDPEAKLIIVG